MASGIALAGDEIRMAENGFMMIHNPWTCACGDSAAMRETADFLDKLTVSSLRPAYVNKTGKTDEEIQSMLDAETWMSADEALEQGFVDVITDGGEDINSHYDLSIFAKAPTALVEQNSFGTPDERSLESVLRDAGLSRKQAKTLLTNGYKSLRDAEVEDTDLSEIVSALRNCNAALKSSILEGEQ